MPKLTYEQAVALVEKASQQSTELKHYRFGQALWNLLPERISSAHITGENDFFYWVDNARVVEVFYKHFVEPAHTAKE